MIPWISLGLRQRGTGVEGGLSSRDGRGVPGCYGAGAEEDGERRSLSNLPQDHALGKKVSECIPVSYLPCLAEIPLAFVTEGKGVTLMFFVVEVGFFAA